MCDILISLLITLTHPDHFGLYQVDRNFVNKMYGYLRCVCSVMLQDKVYDFGFDGTTVELGIVSLGTSTADGTKKAVKVSVGVLCFMQ